MNCGGDRLGQQRIDAAPLDFLRHQPDADEDRDEQAEDRDGREPEILDDLDVLPGGELADQERRRDQQHREEREVVRDPIAHRFLEDVDRDPANRPHRALPFAVTRALRRPRRRAGRRSLRACRGSG